MKRPSASLILATLALFVSIGGTAVAAAHYLITSTKQIKPSVLRQLRGHTGPQGIAGPQGPTGLQGPAGGIGPAGPVALQYVTSTACAGTGTSTVVCSASCPTALPDPVGGGLSASANGTPITSTYPIPPSGSTPGGWQVQINGNGVPITYTVYAICAAATSVR
jgi:hypothetical protein